MAGQQALFLETFVGMRRALARQADASDAYEDLDGSVTYSTNRGNKLKRRARWAQEGRLEADGPRKYKKKTIEHAGYKRYIISRNPPRLDEDGDVVEDYDDDEEVDGEPAEDDPYEEIKLESLLAPLTSAAELPTHPSLSIPYYSKHLTEMVENAREILQREQAALWRIKRLCLQFRGDDIWAPCGMFESANDSALFGKPQDQNTTGPPSIATETDQTMHDDIAHVGEGLLLEQPVPVVPSESNAQQLEMAVDTEQDQLMAEAPDGVEDTSMTLQNGVTAPQHGEEQQTTSTSLAVQPPSNEVAQPGALVEDSVPSEAPAIHPIPEPSPTDTHPTSQLMNNGIHINDFARNLLPDAAADEDESRSSHASQRSHRMNLRQRASRPLTPVSNTPPPSPPPSIHPLFIPPATSHPDCTLSLPQPEADETRKLLSLYAQKQEEVVRGCRQLYEGLLRAERLRKEVLKWSKAEGHLGEMSDGEDWYDMEEWGLEYPLSKGKEEEEEDTTGGVGAKRARRGGRG